MIFRWGNVEKGAEKAGKRTMKVRMLTCAKNILPLTFNLNFSPLNY
jgi:hypothetical protein